jgi:nucleoside-diphosphate-sugar epimerase/quercetin dioxygenase-like cupin family protein
MYKQKIVITGGLGYIGTELCKIYSGESRYKEIVVIDSRFSSDRVTQLRDWGIRYINTDIFDIEILEKEISNADVVIHLAGVTDVAYTKTESNVEKDESIRRVGIDGTRNIIKYAGEKTKIVFPSTHVVYEGFEETMNELSEEVKPCPVLTYAKGKVQSEEDLMDSKRDFVILRLASVYGYSTDTMRIGIMPNLFSKISSQDGTLKLFSGGVQLKSLVPLIDVARCMKFMAESKYTREIFHLSKENMTVKEVAELCKEINPNTTIVETEDEIPNLGYTISNKKLLATGFEFRYNIKDSIREMIQKWSKKEIRPELEFIQRGEKEFVDERGKISNYELTEPINLIGYIESKAGTVRANHYHPIQEQKCLLVKGKYVSVIKDLSDENSLVETRLIKEGDIAVIKPNVAHTMVFLEDSIFLNLVRGEREHENYGITHTIPYILVDEKFRKQLIDGFKTECRSCGNVHVEKVLSLGKSPLANNLLNDNSQDFETYPLEIDYCPVCHNVQLNYVVKPEEMFSNYLYVSSTAKSFRNHFENAAIEYISRFGLDQDSLVVDIGSNDGVFLKPLMERGVRVVGVEPAKNISDLANSAGVTTVNSFFNSSTVVKIKDKYGKAKIVTASNVFAHSDGLKQMAIDAFSLLEEDGNFIVEVQYLLDTIKDLTFDNIYHEHVNYWSVSSISNFFERIGFFVVDVEHIDTHGGSIRVFVGRNAVKSENLEKFLSKEDEFGLKEYSTYVEFGEKVRRLRENVRKNLNTLNSKMKVAAYGSPAKATTALNFYGVDSNSLEYTVEDNSLKKDKVIPGTGIVIKDKQHCVENLPDVIVVLAWNFFEDIKRNNQDLVDRGVRFVSIKDLEKENFEI